MRRQNGESSAPQTNTAAPRLPLWLWAAPLAFLALFFFYPLSAVLRLAGETALTAGLERIAWPRVGGALWFTFWQASLSTLLTLLVGLPAAFVLARYRFRGKRILSALLAIPFILPTVVTAAGFNALLGPNGWINALVIRAFDLASPPVVIINTLSAILLAHIFYNTSVVIRVVGSSWEQLDYRLEQAARSLGASGGRAFLEVTLPLLRPAILAAALLVFLFDFTSFGVILLLGGPRFTTLEVEIYLQTMQFLNLPLAGLLSMLQLACTLSITALYLRLNRRQPVSLSPRVSLGGLWTATTARQRMLVGGVMLGVGALLLKPLTALVLRSVLTTSPTESFGLTLDYYRELFVNRRQTFFYVPPILALRNSLIYGAVTVMISLGLGLLTAFALNRRGRFERVMEAVLMLPLGTSAVTLGLGFLVVFSRPPVDLRSAPWLIPAAHSLVALPFVVRTIQPVLTSIPPVLREAAAVLGASPWRVRREIDLPIAARAALAGAVFAFTISLGEFGATSFLARPEYPTLPVAIFRFLSQPGGLNYGQAMAMATLLMAICGLSVLLIENIEIG
ncbi:MAG: iron ABC transporter permease [Anaerolineaceae bacterium]|nr:iron ABC transporter permease [Anaerolineaceae bacterium]